MRLEVVTGAIIALATLAIDQATKVWAMDVFAASGNQPVEVLPFLNFALAWNRGVSFGLFAADSDMGRWALIGFAGAASLVIAWLISRATTIMSTAGYGLILGGAIGNVIDRARFGAVFDFIDAHAMGWHFWTFNVADAGITLGVVCLLIDALFGDMKGDQPG